MALKTPEYLQTKLYDASRDRLVTAHGGAVQAGVWDASDFKVIQRAAGANMSVDVGSGFALVQAPDGIGLYHEQNDAAMNVSIAAAHATLPRIDRVVLRVNDSTDGGDADDTPLVTVLTGTATSGATLDNLTGAPAVPAGDLLLGDVLVGAAVTSITTSNIRDRRRWARGFNYIASYSGSDQNLPNPGPGAVYDPLFKFRAETGGGAFVYAAKLNVSGTAGALNINWRLYIDGAHVQTSYTNIPNAGIQMPAFVAFQVPALAAGNHEFQLQMDNGGAASILRASTAQLGPTVHAYEIPRQNTAN